ncbi:hypothetical protein ACFX2G_044231 [Malus domestica]
MLSTSMLSTSFLDFSPSPDIIFLFLFFFHCTSVSVSVSALVKSEFFREWDAEFRHARMHSVIGAVEPGVPLNALVLHFAQRHRQWVADGKTATAVLEENVMQVALR